MNEQWLSGAASWLADWLAKLRSNLGPLGTSPSPTEVVASKPLPVSMPEEAQAAPTYRPLGHVGPVTSTMVCGWVWDAQAPETRLHVKVYVNGAVVATVLADQFRKDLREKGIGDGSYGFKHNFAKPVSAADKVEARVEELDYWLITPRKQEFAGQQHE